MRKKGIIQNNLLMQYGKILCVSNANRAFDCTKYFVRFINSHANVKVPGEFFSYRDTRIDVRASVCMNHPNIRLAGGFLPKYSLSTIAVKLDL